MDQISRVFCVVMHSVFYKYFLIKNILKYFFYILFLFLTTFKPYEKHQFDTFLK